MLKSKLELPRGARGKDIDKYLDRVYEYNKSAIDALDEEGLFGTRVEGKELFKEEIKMYLKRNHLGIEDAGDAIKAFGRTELFYSRTERRVENAIGAIRKNPEVYNRLRRAWGWNRKLDWNAFTPTEDKDVYVMGNLMINFKNSPFEIIITII